MVDHGQKAEGGRDEMGWGRTGCGGKKWKGRDEGDERHEKRREELEGK